MEVGAVKQAFNNEVILLKRKLDQAKIQTIHKLTRKAKTLTEKKLPEQLKLKFTKKAESAVKEVLIIKKIKARDIAKFIVTHKLQLDEYLNRPTVDQDKACARLLLHKALQDKYKIIRERFSNISINDLLMSRQERRKLKKEAREVQKNKKKGKSHNESDPVVDKWAVEDIHMDGSELNQSDNDVESSAEEHDEIESKDDESGNNESVNNGVFKPDHLLKSNVSERVLDGSEEDSNDEVELENEPENTNKSCEAEGSGEDENAGKFVKLVPSLSNDNMIINNKRALQQISELKGNSIKNEVEKKIKDNKKNKNLKNKILLKKFNKEKTETLQENKVVDPFFITATGENYMSVAEPRPPDEVKEVHKQGNRKYRRAVMFGHVPKIKPRRDDFRDNTNNLRFNKSSENHDRSYINKSSGFNKHGLQKQFDNSLNNNDESNFKGKRNYNKNNIEDESKPEKLHPSWEAKKRQSGILPFQGKKIVFDES